MAVLGTAFEGELPALPFQNPDIESEGLVAKQQLRRLKGQHILDIADLRSLAALAGTIVLGQLDSYFLVYARYVRFARL